MKSQFRFRQCSQPFHYGACGRIVHHGAAYGRFRGMDGYIQRAYPALQDPLELCLPHIGQGYIVPHDERHAPVIVLYVQGTANALWHLVDKAEHAFVPAGLHPVHKAGFKAQPQGCVLSLFYGTALLLPLPQECELQLCTGGKGFVVYQIPHLFPVDGQQYVSGPHPRPLGRREPVYFCYGLPLKILFHHR